MLCSTTRSGMECFFMTEKGCTFNGGTCHEAVDKCTECGHLIEVADKKYCRAFPDPASKWALGDCNFSTYSEWKQVGTQHKVNPLKASRKAAAGKL